MSIQKQMTYDLQMSGLKPEDIRARQLEMPERTACGILPTSEGYVIPYYSLQGKALPFYRCRLFANDIKYKQLKGTPNHVYFPPGLMECLKKAKHKFIILTEGEKKAAAAVKSGFPAVAFGGVDSWKNRILLLPKDTQIGAYSYSKELIGCKLPSGAQDYSGVVVEPIAVGFEDMTSFIREHALTVIIIYDSDAATTKYSLKYEVQRAAAELGFELRRRNIPVVQIRQLILPILDDMDKTGLDDYLTTLENGSTQLQTLIEECLAKRSAFPGHPNIEQEMAKKLQASKLSRKDIQKLSLTLITDLDAKGIRMNSETEKQMYYFENKTSRLIKVDLDDAKPDSTSTFAKLLYRNYGVSQNADSRLTKWLATQYPAEDPVEDVNPFRVLARLEDNDDCIRYQISDGLYVKITPNAKKPIEILPNGSENILFESDQVEAIDPDELLKEFAKRQKEPLQMWWEDVLHEVRLKSHGHTSALYALLYYISPWLYRWRGSQLPVEMVIGEAGSGKSTLCELRLNIITGDPHLRNAPTDLKDWNASIVNTGGLHVTDNVQFVDKSLRQRLSDEICRLITEPHPHVEMRKLYTNADVMRLRVDAVFLFTGISQPFTNADLLQRSIIMELDKLAKQASTTDEADDEAPPKQVMYDSTWEETQIERFGGRTAWVSHHLYVLHKFLELVQTRWDRNYQASHRLINFEQTLLLMAELFGVDAEWIPQHISKTTDNKIVEADWSLDGLRQFGITVLKLINNPDLSKLASLCRDVNADISHAKRGIFSAGSIAAWCSSQEAYMECHNLTNGRKLGRYLATHKAMIAQTTGLVEQSQKVHNKTMYKVNPVEIYNDNATNEDQTSEEE